MSDFLSKFDKQNYKKVSDEKPKNVKVEEKAEAEIEPQAEEQADTEEQADAEEQVEAEDEAEETISAKRKKALAALSRKARADEDSVRRKSFEEESEFDPTYSKKKRKKIIAGSIAGAVLCMALFLLYYNLSHVKMPDFIDSPISEASAWMSENRMKLVLEEEFSLEYETNRVIDQALAKGKSVKKGSKITLVVSKGADPDEVIALPDFSKMSKSEVEAWIEENKAESLSIIQEYSDTVENGKFIRQEISNKDITAENYRRKDRATVYFSKGKEVFEKNINVPDFVGKTKAEVETWAKTNEITITFEETPSNNIEFGMVVSQSVAKDEKIAKRESMVIQLSLGKPIKVPHFGEYGIDTASGAAEGLNIQVKEQFSGSVAYGRLISQSIPAGTELTDKDEKNILVVYSCGKPYLNSYYGKQEGELPKAFYDDYTSRGANITYTVYYVDSSEEKGSVVAMSAYNQYVSMNYTVSIGISLGNLQPPAASSQNEEVDQEE